MNIDHRDPRDNRVRLINIRIDGGVADYLNAKARRENVGREVIIETALMAMRDAEVLAEAAARKAANP